MTIRVDPEWWKDIFDEVYLLTDARSVCDQSVTEREVDLICRMLGLHRKDRILDLCGGHGRHSLELYARGFKHCTLVDYSEYLTGHARRQAHLLHRPIEVLRMDARNTGLPPETFEHVLIMGNSLGYCSAAEGDRRILREAYRLLKDEGNVLVDVVNGDTVIRRFNPNAWHEIGEDVVVCRQRELQGNCVRARELVMSRKNGLIRDKTYSIRLYRPDALATLLAGAGFSGVQIITDFRPHQKNGDFGCMENRMLGTGKKPARTKRRKTRHSAK